MKHPKIRDEIGQEDETPQLRRMMELQAQYNELREVVDAQGLLFV
jgi:hypothetical protein